MEAVYTCSACGKVLPRSALVRVGEAYSCREDASCGRWLRAQRKAQRQSRSIKGREAFKLGGR